MDCGAGCGNADPAFPQMPPDPVSGDTELAVSYHEEMQAFIGAGFSEEQAYGLLRTRVNQFWSAWYERYFLLDCGDDNGT